MDEKYIENLGQSNNVDEGLWDRLKSRAAGYGQAAKNIAGGGTTKMQDVQFNSLFQKFLKNSLQTTKDFYKVLAPYRNKLSKREAAEADKILDLHTTMMQMQNIPITEANMFTRPFSVLGAQATGVPSNIINAYKNQLKGYYESFMNDAQKLNIVPAQYITRKIGASFPEAKTFLRKFEHLIGKTPASSSTPTASPSPASPSPAAPTPAAPTPPATPSPAPTPAPAAPTPPPTPPPAPAAPTPPPTPPPVVAPAAPTPPPTPGAPTPPAATGGEMTQAQKVELIYSLIEQALEKINVNLKSSDPKSEKEGRISSSPMLNDIATYWHRDEYKALVPFPPTPQILVNPPQIKIIWKLRWKPEKERAGHTIQYSQEEEDQATKAKQSTDWLPFITFVPTEVIDTKTLKENPSFDAFQKVAESNPQFGKIIELKRQISGPGIGDKELNKGVTKGLRSITQVVQPSGAERGLRKLSGSPEAEGGGSSTAEPPAPPVSPEELKKAPPELKGRTSSTAPAPAAKKKVKSPMDLISTKPTWKFGDKLKPGETPPAAAAAEPEKKKPTPDEIRAAEKEREAKLKKRMGLEEHALPTFKDFFSSL